MTTSLPAPHVQPRRLLPFCLIALLMGSSCTMLPLSAQPGPRAPIAKPAQPQSQRPKNPGSDPRYRPPANFGELQAVAGRVAKATGRVIHWQLKTGDNPGPLATIRGGINDCTIYVHPLAARKVPPNTWAFIIGHEFAHRVENLANHSLNNPANELKADIAGARYAMAAGYRVEAFLGWVFAQPNQTTASHGSLHKRVQGIAAHFRIPQNVIQAEAKRYASPRMTRQTGQRAP